MNNRYTLTDMNDRSGGFLTDLLDIKILSAEHGVLTGSMTIEKKHLAPNGYLHAGSVISLADTACGWATLAHLPEDAASFTTIEIKSNFLGTARSGVIYCTATAEHLGKNTQVWTATVTNEAGKKIAIFCCSQFILYNK